jgi:hypothetical protein
VITAVLTGAQRNDIILPNEDFLRAAEALRLHHFTAIDPIVGSCQYIEGLDHYAAQYTYPPEITERLGSDVSIALFPASLVGWKLVYVPIPDPEHRGSFTTSLTVQKVPVPIDPADVEQSFIQLSAASSDADDAISIASEGSSSTITSAVKVEEDEDDDYIFVEADTPRYISKQRRASIAMERGNGPKSPSDSVHRVVSIKDEKELAKPVSKDTSASFDSSCDIADMKPEPGTGAVEMLPGTKMLEKSEGQLFMIEKALYVPRKEFFRESIENAREFLRRDGNSKTKFARTLDGWELVLG